MRRRAKRLIALLGLLFAALAVTGVVFLTQPRVAPEIIEADFVYAANIAVEGVSLAGMTEEEAKYACAAAINDVVDGKTLTFTAEGESFTYDAEELGASVSVDEVLLKAYNYQKLGSLYPTPEDYEVVDQETGLVNFIVTPSFDPNQARLVLENDIERINRDPQDASIEFDANADQKLLYIEDVPGYRVNVDKLVVALEGEVVDRSYDTVAAEFEPVEAEVTVADLHESIDLIGKYTSDYSEGSLAAKNRVINVEKMAGLMNGVVIEPGEVWSMNEEAGPRTEEGGWALAPGIENGVYTDQPGGGVCQVSSTLYNAALLAELEIVESKRHSWPSGYIPEGLDATISTGGPDLVIQNNRSFPVYIVAYCTEDKKCTVEMYGEKPKHDYEVRYVNKLIKTTPPNKAVVEQRDTDQNGEPLAPGESKRIRAGKEGRYLKVYKQYVDSNGEVVACFFMYDAQYNAKGPVYYENPADPVATS